MKASIIIPAYNEEKCIEKCLKSLLNQTFKDFEIIVVDDGSTDKTRGIVKKIAKKYEKIKLIQGQHKGPGFARNLGASKANGEILVFPDADMTFDKDYLKNLIKPIEQGETFGCEDGRQIASNPNNIWSRCWGTFFRPYINPEKGQIFRAILKKEFDKMGGFDSSLGYADDLTFYYKYGKESTRIKDVVCYHENPSTLKEVFKQSKWIGSSFNYKWLKTPIINYLILLILFVFSPLGIIILSIKKILETKDIGTVLYMPIFMIYRYFGTIYGMFKRITLNKLTR